MLSGNPTPEQRGQLTMRIATVLRLSPFVMLFPLNLVADEPQMPQFESPPQKYEYKHEIMRVGEASPSVVVDELLIGDVSEKEIKFYFYLIRANGHICGGNGAASLREGSFYYSTPSKKEVYDQGKIRKEPVECKLKITFNSNQATLKDEGGNCKYALCGMRAHIGATHFRRVH